MDHFHDVESIAHTTRRVRCVAALAFVRVAGFEDGPSKSKVKLRMLFFVEAWAYNIY
jgi:hypothetical protein